jgi:Tol biopolymer transport system component
MISLPLRVHRRTRLCVLLLLVALGTGCGGDSTSPRNESGLEPGINVVAGANVTDTVGAALPLALRVVVRDAAGHILPDAVVRFSSVPIVRPGGSTVPSVLVGDVSAVGASTFLAETTSASGVAFARIVLGQAAGAGAVAILVPQEGLQDTARYTITPGAATKVVLPIVDTTIQVGRSFALAGRVEDRYGNARTDAVAYEVAGTGLTLTGGQVSASAPARAAMIGRLDRSSLAPDTTWVSVVPAATIAARRGSKLVTVALDGTGLVEIPHTLEAQDPGPEWHPNGQSLLAVLGTFGGPRLPYRVELGGATQRLIDPAAPSTGYIYSATYSPDAQWVYLDGGSCNYASILYRVPMANPQTVQRLSPTGPDECFELVNHWPSLSPDGARLTYENQTWNQQGYSVRVMEIASKAITQIVAGGQRPRWSPSGDLIAYWADKQIWVVRPDGTGARVVSPAGHGYIPGVQWSPDGQWILARFEPTQGWAGTTVALINVSTRLEIPLAWTTGYSGISLPTWKPVP